MEPHRRAECRLQHGVGQRHGGGREGGHAAVRQIAGHFHKAVIVAVREVRAGVAMGVDVHQTGNHIRTVKVDALTVRRLLQHMGEAAVLHREAAGDKAAIHEDIAVTEPHITPPAGWPPPWTGPRGGTPRPAVSRTPPALDIPPSAHGGTPRRLPRRLRRRPRGPAPAGVSGHTP